MLLEAIIRAGLDGDANALGLAPLGIAYGFGHRRACMTRQRVMQVSNKVVLVLCVKGHERPTHHNEFDLHGVEETQRRKLMLDIRMAMRSTVRIENVPPVTMYSTCECTKQPYVALCMGVQNTKKCITVCLGHVVSCLVSRVPKRLELLHTVSCLQVRVVSRADRAHRRWFVTRVRLRRVLKVRVGPTRAIPVHVWE